MINDLERLVEIQHSLIFQLIHLFKFSAMYALLKTIFKFPLIKVLICVYENSGNIRLLHVYMLLLTKYKSHFYKYSPLYVIISDNIISLQFLWLLPKGQGIPILDPTPL